MPFQEETILCRICGTRTESSGTKLCDNCWEMNNHFRSLVERNRKAAKNWLKEQFKKLKEKVDRKGNERCTCNGDPSCGLCDGTEWISFP